MEEKHKYSDLEQYYVNKGYVLNFIHVPSGRDVNFKGLITSFVDKYESNWNDTQVYGRQDPISTFSNTRRIISLSWDVVAASSEEAKENMQKVSLLLAMLYPVYSSHGASSISTSPIFKISFGNLITNVGDGIGGDGVVGKVDGFEFAPNMDEQFFDVAAKILYPQSLSLSCNITVFHTHPLGWDNKHMPRNKKFPYGENIVIENEDGFRNIKNFDGIEEDSGMIEQKSSQINKILGVNKK
jgi:hypothetical protein